MGNREYVEVTNIYGRYREYGEATDIYGGPRTSRSNQQICREENMGR